MTAWAALQAPLRDTTLRQQMTWAHTDTRTHTHTHKHTHTHTHTHTLWHTLMHTHTHSKCTQKQRCKLKLDFSWLYRAHPSPGWTCGHWVCCGTFHPSGPSLRTMKTSIQWYSVDTSYFTHNLATCGGQEGLTPSSTGLEDLLTTIRPVEIHHYWTVPRQTQRMTTPSSTKKWRLLYNHWRKGSHQELTTSQQNWSK